MATGGTPSGRAFVFDIERPRGGGGGASYAPTGYAASYAQGKGIMEMLDWQDKKRREAMEEQWLQGREERQQQKEAFEMSREARQEERLRMQAARDEIAARRQQAAEDRKQARQDQYEQRMDDLDKLTGAIEDIDPLHKDAVGMLNDVRSSQEFHRLMANRDTRQALSETFKSKTGEIKDIVSGIQHEGKTKYGVDVDMSRFPTDEQGRWDFQKGYGEHLPALAQEMMQKAQASYDTAEQRPGYTKYAEKDEYGRPVVKYSKLPEVKPVKPEDIGKEFKTTYGAPAEALSMQYGTKPVKGGIAVMRGSFEEGEFKPSESGDTVQVIDASKGMNKKIIHNIPFEKFESFRSKVQGMNAPSQIIAAPEGIDISSPIGVQTALPQLKQPSTPLPSPTPQATTERPPLTDFQTE